MTERRACRLANQPRGTQRYRAMRREDEDALTQEIVQLASQYGRYGYRRITALLKRCRLEGGQGPGGAIWRREWLEVSRNRSHVDGCGSTMVRACGCGRRMAITSGATISARHDGEEDEMS